MVASWLGPGPDSLVRDKPPRARPRPLPLPLAPRSERRLGIDGGADIGSIEAVYGRGIAGWGMDGLVVVREIYK